MGTHQHQSRPVNLGNLTFDVPHLPPPRKVADEVFLAEAETIVARLKSSGEYERLREREPLPTSPFLLPPAAQSSSRAEPPPTVAAAGGRGRARDGERV